MEWRRKFKNGIRAYSLCWGDGIHSICYLSPDAPESNSDEYLSRDFKTALHTGRSAITKQVDGKSLGFFMDKLTTLPEKVVVYFRHPAAI
ncbi:hypothetical protein [Methylocaldum sp.]|uniref:hypothetical protein n=1 Tax=Methylocaldum sp. TaxID=1969727 RepID=UPI002D55EFEF|nr:hypothetical protein [Methylocaldum sp.]HYE34990.1 hypothetical protein [Methylocaldum sp.]